MLADTHDAPAERHQRLRSGLVKPVHALGVRAEDLTLVRLGQAHHVLGDYVLGIGPRTVAVGEIRRPHQVVDADDVADPHR